jgi:hypothetical protein
MDRVAVNFAVGTNRTLVEYAKRSTGDGESASSGSHLADRVRILGSRESCPTSDAKSVFLCHVSHRCYCQ